MAIKLITMILIRRKTKKLKRMNGMIKNLKKLFKIMLKLKMFNPRMIKRVLPKRRSQIKRQQL